MRILAVTLRYPPYVEGGYERLTHDAVEGLRGLGHEVAVLCGKGKALRQDKSTFATLHPRIDTAANLFEVDRNSSPVERVRNHYFRGGNYSATRVAINTFRPDLVLYFNLGLASLAPLVAARMQRVPSLGYLCDRWAENLWLTDVAANPNKRGRLPWMRGLWSGVRAVAGLSTALCASDWLRSHLIRSGVRSTGLGVLPTGLSPQMDRLARESTELPARELGIRLRVICTSMLWQGKGQHVLVQAFGRAVAEGLDGELVLAGTDPGDGSYRAKLIELAREARVEERVFFVGLLSPEDLSGELQKSHVFVLPSIWGEPFGLSTIEAMAHGLCAVVTDSGASQELVSDAGVVVATEDVEALVRVLLVLGGDEERRRQLGKKARARALEQFGRDTFLRRLESACHSVAAGQALASFGSVDSRGVAS